MKEAELRIYGYRELYRSGCVVIRSIWGSPLRYDPLVREELRGVIGQVRQYKQEASKQ